MLRKIIVLIIICSHFVTYTIQPACAALPLALLAASAIGATMAASATGSYYAKNGTMPEYVKTASTALASAADTLFQPSYLAVGPMALVTAASFPNTVSVYLGKDAAIGATIGNIINKVIDSDLYNDLKSLFVGNSVQNPADFTGLLAGSIYDSSGSLWKIPPSWNGSWGTQYISSPTNNPVGPRVVCGEDAQHIYYNQTYNLPAGYAYLWKVEKAQAPGWSPGSHYAWFIAVNSTTGETTLPPGALDYDYEQIQQALANMNTAVAEDVRKAIKDLPIAEQIKAQDVPLSGTGSPPVAITPADIQASLAQNTAQVAQAAKTAADDRLALDPTNPILQQAASQAAVDLAKAQADAAEKELSEEDYTASVPSLAVQTWPEIDFSPITTLSSRFSTVFPFGIITSIASGFNQLDGSPVTPQFTIDLGLTQREVTLSPFDGFASILRSIVSFLMYCLTGFFCFKLYTRA